MHQPPTVTQIRRALDALGPALDERHALARALHLALPRGVVAGMAVSDGLDGRLSYRGASIARTGDVARVARRVALAGLVEGDEFVDLEGAPERWVKVLPSGSGLVVFGARLLFGLPTLVAETGVTPEALYDVVARARAGEIAPPQVLEGGRLVDGGGDRWSVRRVDGGRVSLRETFAEPDLRGLGEEMRHALGGEECEIVELGGVRDGAQRVEVLVGRGRLLIVVPVVVSADSRLVGVEPDVLDEGGTPVGLDVPADFEPLGVSRYESAVVARHRSSGYRVLLTEDPPF